jgi:hypothetical protein
MSGKVLNNQTAYNVLAIEYTNRGKEALVNFKKLKEEAFVNIYA